MVHVGSLIALLVFYLVILIIGLVAAWKKTRQKTSQHASETLIVANRDISTVVGLFTVTAVWVGGGYIMGTTEGVYTGGLIWCQAPVGYALSLALGGLFFAKPMRENRYVTMLDPFQKKYGKRTGAVMYIPAFVGEIFWSAAILASLGASISVIVELDFKIAVIISASVAVLYTFFGGQYSVCYTDVAQLILITFGLVLCTPFAWHSPYVWWNKRDDFLNATSNDTMISDFSKVNETSNRAPVDWIGKISAEQIPRYIDEFLLLIFGGIPWQDYFQRVLSAKSTRNAQVLSVFGGFMCLIFSIPSIIIGYVALNTDWDATGYGAKTVADNTQMILPLVLQYLTPTAAACFGLGAVAAGVMSSTDASVLSTSSMFTHNIYKTIFRPKSSDFEIMCVLRIGFILAGAIAAALAIVDQSVYALWVFCSDFVYVILFPQLVCVIYCGFVNSYGLLSGSFISIVLRILGGEPSLHLPPILKYPFFDYENKKQIFPFKTFCMLLNFAITCIVSVCAKLILRYFPEFDVLDIIHQNRYSFDSSTVYPSEASNVECKVMKINENKESVNGVITLYIPD